MAKRGPIPTLTRVIDEQHDDAEKGVVHDKDLEGLVKSLEAQFQPMISNAIRAAVKDAARRMALDLRKRMGSDIEKLIRKAVDETLGGKPTAKANKKKRDPKVPS